MIAFLADTFQRLGGRFSVWSHPKDTAEADLETLAQAVEHVLDATDRRLRAVPGYVRLLKTPVARTFQYIDELVESVPGVVTCNRSAFAEDARVNAFFASPDHLQEVFSQSKEVRELFDRNPKADECYGLLCMRTRERRQLGMSMVGDSVQKEVMQTSVSFSNHQLVSPSSDESGVKRALKCCVFNHLLAEIRKQASNEKIHAMETQNRLRLLRGQLRQANQSHTGNADVRRLELQREITQLEQQFLHKGLERLSLGEQLDSMAKVLGHPETHLCASYRCIRVNRMGIKLEANDRHEAGAELCFSEIQIASQQPRVAALVRFPRRELLPKPDFLKQADLFLAL